MECGNVVKLNYIGPEEDPHARTFRSLSSYSARNDDPLTCLCLPTDDHGHGHGHTAPEEPKTFADYVKPEYWYR